MTTQELLAEIETFVARDDVKMTESTFGRLAVNDGKLVSRLRENGDLTFKTADKIRSFISSYRPTSIVAPAEAPPPDTGASSEQERAA